MYKALLGSIAFTLLVVGSSTNSSETQWRQANSEPISTLIHTQPSVLAGASDKRLPKVPPTAIRKISCGGGWGTGVVISPDTVMTANHVIEGQTNCHDDETNEVFEITYVNATQDFALLHYPRTRHTKFIPVSCEGFIPNRTYYAYGYAGVGTGDLASFRLRATDEFAPAGSKDERSGTIFTGTRVLTGTVIQGMSGGPIVDVRGRVIGLNNATAMGYTIGLSREIKTTFLCMRNPIGPKSPE